MTTPEQAARDILERLGVDVAQSMTSGDLVEMANVIAECRRLRELLNEVYEAQPAACIGNIGRGGPCGTCLWCRVRAALMAGQEKEDDRG